MWLLQCQATLERSWEPARTSKEVANAVHFRSQMAPPTQRMPRPKSYRCPRPCSRSEIASYGAVFNAIRKSDRRKVNCQFLWYRFRLPLLLPRNPWTLLGSPLLWMHVLLFIVVFVSLCLFPYPWYFYPWRWLRILIGTVDVCPSSDGWYLEELNLTQLIFFFQVALKVVDGSALYSYGEVRIWISIISKSAF